mmetsp:Transcript_10015/g.23277  ORF Transcript_10015/g.23277 Transcript_10015/m.23277 type:complete len:171 (-) Transcript_10015:10-522(-)
MQGGKAPGGSQPVSTFGLFLVAWVGTTAIQFLARISLYLVCPGLAAYFALAGPVLSRTASRQDFWYGGFSALVGFVSILIGFSVAELSLFRRRDDSDDEERRLQDPSIGMACLIAWIVSVMLAAVAAEFRQDNLKSPFRLRVVTTASCVLLACSISLFSTFTTSILRTKK